MTKNKIKSLDLPQKDKYSYLLDLIPHGEENAVNMRTLASVLNVDCRSVRQAVMNARISGCVICSSEEGYFQPGTYEELLHYVRKVKAQARSKYLALLPAEKALKEGNYPGGEGADLN